jgi:cytochrome c biogenesis protein CcmG/thiol:disulfide interchange protein DsbE
MRRLMVVPLSVVALAAVIWVALLRPGGAAAPRASGHDYRLDPAAERRAIPDLAARALDPPPLRLSLRPLDARPSLVDVWASWCLPCKEEAPMLAALHRRYGREVRFLGIDVEDTRGAARAFERRYRIGYPSIFDQSASMAGKLGFIGLPTLFLVDQHGRIAATLAGEQTRLAIETRVRRLIDESRSK